MYNINPINIGNSLNGRDVMIMSSSSDADAVIKEFKNRVHGGVDPNVLVQEILDDFDLSEDDFTDNDIARINSSIKRIYEATRRNF